MRNASFAENVQVVLPSPMSLRSILCGFIAAVLGSGALPLVSLAADWPQYMRDARHSADAHDERLSMPLALADRVELDDAVLTSPVVVAGQVYVVDQMGTAYCIDPDRAAIVWKTQPPGADAAGGNTSSPCVVDGQMAYGTTAGNFYLLDAATGKVLRSVSFNQPILGAITAANERYYLQTLDGVILAIRSICRRTAQCWLACETAILWSTSRSTRR
jgi:hypothetical protein